MSALTVITSFCSLRKKVNWNGMGGKEAETQEIEEGQEQHSFTYGASNNNNK